MALKNPKIHVARSGAILGAYDRDKVGDLMDTGHLRPTDHYFEDATGEWTLLSTLEAPSHPPSAEFKPNDKPEASPESSDPSSSRSGSSRRGGSKSKAKAKKGAQSAIAGWIACLLGLGVAAGIWAYAQSLSDQLAAAQDNVALWKQKVDILQHENQLLSEITPAGRVRAVITYTPSANQVAVMSGATVGLYKRQDVQTALSKIAVDSIDNDSQFDDAVNRLKTAIPSPLQVTLTDSNGRIDLETPGSGDYVLMASAAKATSNGTEKYLWLIGFHTGDQPSNLVLLNEKNAISVRKPQFSIVDVSGLASGL